MRYTRLTDDFQQQQRLRRHKMKTRGILYNAERYFIVLVLALDTLVIEQRVEIIEINMRSMKKMHLLFLVNRLIDINSDNRIVELTRIISYWSFEFLHLLN